MCVGWPRVQGFAAGRVKLLPVQELVEVKPRGLRQPGHGAKAGQLGHAACMESAAAAGAAQHKGISLQLALLQVSFGAPGMRAWQLCRILGVDQEWSLCC